MSSSPPKPPPCKETICSTKKDALKSMLAAQSSKPGPSAPAAPCPPDREELGRHTWTLVRVPLPLTLIATRHPEHAALLLVRCTRSLLTSPRGPAPPSARQPPPSYTCWVGSTLAATALRTSGPPWRRAPRGESSQPRLISFLPCRQSLGRRPWQHWLAWRALRMDVRSPQPRQPPTGQAGVFLRALAAGHALVQHPRPTRTCRGTADAVSPRCWTGATEASDVVVKRSSRTFPAPGSSGQGRQQGVGRAYL
jgi:hypothetical protein